LKGSLGNGDRFAKASAFGEGGERGILSQRLLVGPDGFLVLSEAQQNAAEIALGLRVVRFQLKKPRNHHGQD
jgi:hypothetical protein